VTKPRARGNQSAQDAVTNASAVMKQAKARLDATEARIDQLTEALELIDRYGCSHFSNVLTTTRCLTPGSGKVRGHIYGYKSWCNACIARYALIEPMEDA
jgi:hypothetical protein